MHERVLRQELGQPGAGGCLALHAQGHGGQPPQQEPAVKGPQDGPLRILRRLGRVSVSACGLALGWGLCVPPGAGPLCRVGQPWLGSPGTRYSMLTCSMLRPGRLPEGRLRS